MFEVHPVMKLAIVSISLNDPKTILQGTVKGKRKRGRQKKIFLVGCFGLNGPLRQYFSLYRAVSQREGERIEM